MAKRGLPVASWIAAALNQSSVAKMVFASSTLPKKAGQGEPDQLLLARGPRGAHGADDLAQRGLAADQQQPGQGGHATAVRLTRGKAERAIDRLVAQLQQHLIAAILLHRLGVDIEFADSDEEAQRIVSRIRDVTVHEAPVAIAADTVPLRIACAIWTVTALATARTTRPTPSTSIIATTRSRSWR